MCDVTGSGSCQEYTVVNDHDRQKDALGQVYCHELLQLDAELKCEQVEGVPEEERQHK